MATDDSPSLGQESGTEKRGTRETKRIEKSRGELDPFFRDRVYPDATNLFTVAIKPLEAIKDECFVVIDTNQLLKPFTLSHETLTEIGKVYQQLKSKNRLVIPAQVAREFVDRRFTKISDTINALREYQSRAANAVKHPVPKLNYPFLKGKEKYEKLVEVIEEAKRKCDEAKKSYDAVSTHISDLVDEIRGWLLDDPVSELYRRLFAPSVIIERTIDYDAEIRDFRYRKMHKIPPGFNDERIGDYLIWLVILKIGTEKKKPVVFVSGDEKNDWIRSSGSTIIAPRYEMLDEFCRVSDGQGFYFISLSELLTLYNASEESIKEVKKAEEDAAAKKLPRVSRSPPRLQLHHLQQRLAPPRHRDTQAMFGH